MDRSIIYNLESIYTIAYRLDCSPIRKGIVSSQGLIRDSDALNMVYEDTRNAEVRVHTSHIGPRKTGR
jgi:hypothetical protein